MTVVERSPEVMENGSGSNCRIKIIRHRQFKVVFLSLV